MSFGEAVFGLIIFAYVFALAYYIVTSIILFKFYKLKYNKNNFLVLVPLFKEFYLGKLLVNNKTGYIFCFFSIVYYTYLMGFLKPFSQFEDILFYTYLILSFASFCTYAISLHKYNRLKADKQMELMNKSDNYNNIN